MKVSKGILYRNVDSKKHFHIKLRAYMFDVKILENLPTWFELRIITKAGRVYRITQTDFEKYAYLHSAYGKYQMVIPVKYLECIANNTNLKTISLFTEQADAIKENAKAERLTIREYVVKKCLA